MRRQRHTAEQIIASSGKQRSYRPRECRWRRCCEHLASVMRAVLHSWEGDSCLNGNAQDLCEILIHKNCGNERP